VSLSLPGVAARGGTVSGAGKLATGTAGAAAGSLTGVDVPVPPDDPVDDRASGGLMIGGGVGVRTTGIGSGFTGAGAGNTALSFNGEPLYPP